MYMYLNKCFKLSEICFQLSVLQRWTRDELVLKKSLIELHKIKHNDCHRNPRWNLKSILQETEYQISCSSII